MPAKTLCLVSAAKPLKNGRREAAGKETFSIGENHFRSAKRSTGRNYLSHALQLSQPDSYCPAFDANPDPDKREHVLNIDDADNRPNLDTVLLTSEWYELAQSKAEQIIEEVVQRWLEVARKIGISGVEIELMRSVFSGFQSFNKGEKQEK
jgi:hypothetical protein